MAPRQRVHRRTFLRVGALAAGTAACAPTATAPAAAPAGQPAAPAQKAAWEQEWDRLVAAAKQEGRLSLFTLTGAGYRKAAEAFQSTFGIPVDHSAEGTASVWVPKMDKEREAGIYSYDVVVVPPNSALIRLKPKAVWDPIRPLIFRPDVLDDKAWREGFDKQWMDLDKQLAFGYNFEVNHTVAIDTGEVKPDDIKGLRDLTDPKWKGRIMISDVRHGSIWVPMQWIRTKVAGADDLIKKLLFDQQPLFIRDDRAKAEQIVRKRSAIGLGILPAPLAEFRDAGVAGHVQFLNRAELDYATTYTVLLYNRAPHPNAAKLFINWFLSKEGQTAWCKEIPTNSARTDVPPYFPEGVGERGVQYYFANHESEYERQSATLKWLTDMLGLSS